MGTRACRRARVELGEMSLATPLFALAVPRAHVQSSEGLGDAVRVLQAAETVLYVKQSKALSYF